MKKEVTKEQWKELGTLCKALHDGLIRAATIADGCMGKRDLTELNRSANHLSEFKSHAEDLMFRQFGRDTTDNDLNIFYGARDDFKKVLKSPDTKTGEKPKE
jgi:hypothetical protein